MKLVNSIDQFNEHSCVYIGMKFWKTGKIVKAISEADYLKLQRSRVRNDPRPSKPPTVVLTDSDSDGPLIPLARTLERNSHGL